MTVEDAQRKIAQLRKVSTDKGAYLRRRKLRTACKRC
jgi:hypothetical protein